MAIDTELLKGSLNIIDFFKVIKNRLDFAKIHPNYFVPDGLMVFCGSQGSGKTLSAVQYSEKCLDKYFNCVFCTNVEIRDYPINCYYKDYIKKENNLDKHIVEYYTLLGNELVRRVTSYFFEGEQQADIEKFEVIGFSGRIVVEYDGINCIKALENGEEGILYLIDEIHLEFNSLESKNIPIDVMVEVSQQRKQRKHILGTSQVYMRMAKPLREQIKEVVICRNFFKFIQYNRLVDGETSHEEDGKLCFDTVKRVFWFHSIDLYNSYDTYKKMKRYRKEWNGTSKTDIYDNKTLIVNNEILK